jgi:hypothetical protein
MLVAPALFQGRATSILTRSKSSGWNEARARTFCTDGSNSNRCRTGGTGPETRRGTLAGIVVITLVRGHGKLPIHGHEIPH